MLQLKKHKTNKNIFSIDKKTNLLTTICLALNDAHIDIKQCLKGFDMTSPGYITKNEFLLFVKSQTAVLTDNDIEFLYNTYDDGARGAVSKDVIVASLETTQQQVDAYTNLAHHQYSGTLSQFDMQNQYYRLLEERKHFEFRLAQMRARLSELEKANDAVNKELTLRSEEHKKTVDKYFKAMTENTQIKSEYVTNGVTKADLISLEENNDALVREVTLLRIGLNTFKELYNSSNTQIKQLQLYKVKINDELDTYKRALKELQGETNANALIGKLYYTILLSRWREANTLRRYDEFVNEFAMMKEENFQLDTQSRNLVKDFTQLQVEFHKITIENVRMSDQIENYENGIVVYSSTDKSQSHPIEALKLLTKELSKDRDELTSQVITLKKQLMKVDIEKEELKNQIAFCMTIADKIRFDNQDQYSKKLIALCDEVAKLKLATNVCKRENTFLSENEKHLSHIIEQLTTNVKTLEVDNAEWESKFRTMEEIYRVKDNERQTKLFTALSKLSIYDVNELQLKLNSKDSATSSSVSNTKTITTGNNGVKKVIAPVSNNPKDKIIFAEYETQLKTLQHALSLKDDEIRRLTMINNENMKLLQQNKTMFNNNNNNSIANLVGQSGYDVIKDDETKLVAKTAHKTIKTLQDMLTQKNTLLKKKEENIEELRKENYEIKQNYTARIHVLEDKLKNDHQQTMKKLSNVIDSSNANLIVKKTKNELSLLNMNDLEKLIDDKDNTIKALAIELHATKEQRDNALALLEGKNKQIIEMNSNNAMNNSINSRQSKKMTTSVRSVKKK
jgi:chromosome segregation ATPase